MVRRGSTVRVRQRASGFLLLSRCFRCLVLARLAASASTQRPPASTVAVVRAELVEEADRVLASVACEVAVVAVDHGQAGAHVAGEVEGGDAGTEREGREGVSEIVDPPERFDPRCELCGFPLAVAEVVQVEVAAALGREEQRGSAARLAAGRARRARSPAAVPRAARLSLRALEPPFVNERRT